MTIFTEDPATHELSLKLDAVRFTLNHSGGLQCTCGSLSAHSLADHDTFMQRTGYLPGWQDGFEYAQRSWQTDAEQPQGGPWRRVGRWLAGQWPNLVVSVAAGTVAAVVLLTYVQAPR